MNFKITFELNEKELAAALLPNGGKITDVAIEEKPTRRRRSAPKEEKASPKPRASRTKKAQAKEA